MTASTLTLTDFLLARIAEDERVAFDLRDEYPHEPGPAYLSDNWDLIEVTTGYGRVLAECGAKRRIMKAHPIYRGDRIQPISTRGADFGCEECHALDRLHGDSLIEAIGYCDTLLALALPYADHPDYREEWRP